MTLVAASSRRARHFQSVPSSGVWTELSVMLNDVAGNAGTVTIFSGGGGAGVFSLTQSATNITPGDSWIRIGGVNYPIAAWDGGGNLTATGAPAVTTQPFTLTYPKKFWLFVPGSLSGQVRPYPFLMGLHGGPEKGKDDLLQMSWNPNNGSIPQAAGFPNNVTGVQWSTTPPFGRDNWPFITAMPQGAVSNTGTAEIEALLNAVYAYVVANYPTDPHRTYLTGYSGGANWGYSYAAKYASRYAGIVMEAGTPSNFFCTKFSGVAIGGTYAGATDDDAADFCAAALAAQSVDVRVSSGSADTSGAIIGLAHSDAAFAAAYAAAGISGKYSNTVYAGQDHVTSYTTTNQNPATWAALLTRNR